MYRVDPAHRLTALDVYLNLGRNRSVVAVHKQMQRLMAVSPPVLAIENWAVGDKWDERAKEWDAEHPDETEVYFDVDEDVTTASQMSKCQMGMQLALEKRDLGAYCMLLKHQSDLAGLIVKKEAVIVKNVDDLTIDELKDEYERNSRILKQLGVESKVKAATVAIPDKTAGKAKPNKK